MAALEEELTSDVTTPMSPEVAQVLVENHRRFLQFLEARVGRRDVAEEILQDAFVRGLGRGGAIRESEAATAWFYRVLRNALTDYYRRQGTRARALDAVQYELAQSEDEEVMREVCACVTSLLDTLKPEYAEAVRSLDLTGTDVAEFAKLQGITPNNARVRLHRAREALHKQLVRSCGTCAQHGCIDCTCQAGKCSEK
jgi:RNA polymerase sigma-70 factor (ECF subfamily)